MNKLGISIAAVVLLGAAGALWFSWSDDARSSDRMKEVEFEDFESAPTPSESTEPAAEQADEQQDPSEEAGDRRAEREPAEGPTNETESGAEKTANTEVEVLSVERESESSDRAPRPVANNRANKESDNTNNRTAQTTSSSEQVDQAAANMVDPNQLQQMNRLPNALKNLRTPPGINPAKLPTAPKGGGNNNGN